MSRTGNCYDDAVAGPFFWSLKHQWTSHDACEHLEAARQSVFKYIETFYDTNRIHQTLDDRTPEQYEAEHASALAGRKPGPPLSVGVGLSQRGWQRSEKIRKHHTGRSVRIEY